MGLNYDILDNVIEIDETCTVEDAETLLQLVLEHPDAAIDMHNCAHMHTAAVQVILAAKPKFRRMPEDEFMKRFLVPYWDLENA
jgi:hypothetical protein